MHADHIPSPKPTDHAALTLRSLAEARWRDGDAAMVVASANQTAQDAQNLIHELQVHQIELEMQCEELMRSQQELETTRARYFELYDLAPVGYCMISNGGLIQEANLTAAALLGRPQSKLIKRVVDAIYCA
jgi:PAS domain-containing protein